jgi:hypothetical protein
MQTCATSSESPWALDIDRPNLVAYPAYVYANPAFWAR